MIQRLRKPENDQTRSVVVPLSEGINTQVGGVMLRVSCPDNNAALILELRNTDRLRQDGQAAVEMKMDWKDLAYLLTEKLEVSFKNRYGMAEFTLERILNGRLFRPGDDPVRG